ncbi:MAG: M20/M25/M40 family metallo-hydrolase, partial [Alphaproteobacteria bacterium]|nr:M20/M25/M40 family metallo-hydrolase [Alphaproteobacteria bacterium]
MNSNLANVLAAIDSGLDESLKRLFELLRFPSIGADPAHAGDCRRAADWLVKALADMGFEAGTRETASQPVVVARYAARALPSHAPQILFYGHYDVQPADPLDLWESPPFEPQIRTGKDGRARIFARGACDDKGQLMTFLEASRAWIGETGSLPFRLTVLLEGDEEGDASHLDRFLRENRREFSADTVFVCDTGMWNRQTPAINTMLRGCIGEEVTISGPQIDLHSGDFGGPATDPIRILAAILADMHDGNGRIAIPGFYKGVKTPPAALRRQWRDLRFPARKYLRDVGLREPAGEKGFSVLEQMWARPTAEVNGIWGGYTGVGTKTVIPARAQAKISFRLVKGQSAAHVRKAFRQFVRARLPAGCRARFDGSGGDSTGVSVAADSPWIALATRALRDEWGKAPIIIGGGYSIPVV